MDLAVSWTAMIESLGYSSRAAIIVSENARRLGKMWVSGRLLNRKQQREQKQQAVLLRDIFGNPFRPITLDSSWLTSTVTALARQMYDSRDFSAMPILVDALQDAGCGDDQVLSHCRGPGPHVRGCFVVDACLNKT
ncbi:hypothetical protein FRUB_09046 [Fimbriiglobus ruber]|uniref:Uncharacterized protein n=1 Tax=Fimbriiglobus ruber TaxID=1908690 RepID=A0A225D676_9BACT|nr:hypothetical protein FRUB_09046 [Fimbriiglobus ruber]